MSRYAVGFPQRRILALVTLGWLGSSGPALAAPGQGFFLSGIEAQGPASTRLSAVFHNPAMLTELPGLHLQLSLNAKLHTQRTQVALRSTNGLPIPNGFEPRQTYRNWGADGFFGASFLFENFAIAAAYYSLDSKFVERAPESLAGFVRANPSPYCRLNPAKRCPGSAPYAGWAEVPTEFTFALAWQTIRRLKLGLSLHLLRYRLRGSRTRPAKQEATQGLCEVFFPSDPECTELEQLRFQTEWTNRDPAGSRIQVAMTAGIAWTPNDRWTFGARYRMRPNFGLRTPIYPGTLQGCAISSEGVLQCERKRDAAAQLEQSQGRQVALGASFRPFGDRLLNIDVQAYWIQDCPVRQRSKGCQLHPDATITVLGRLDSPRIVDRPWYRGRQDRWGAELWLHRSLQRNIVPRFRRLAYTAGLGGYSASVHPSAHNPIDSDGTGFFGAANLSIELLRRNSSMFLVTGYALTWQRPRELGHAGISPAFMPDAFGIVQSQGQGIDGPAGQAVMSGKARASNAGRYHSLRQAASIALRWGAR